LKQNLFFLFLAHHSHPSRFQNHPWILFDAEVKENKIVVDDGTLVEELSNLRYGDYAVREIDAPEGYINQRTVINNDFIFFHFCIRNKCFVFSFTVFSKNLKMRGLANRRWLKNSVIFDMEIMRSEK
jgi:hypothetical protein